MMEIIEQTNRTILFDVVNPEVFNMFNIMSDAVNKKNRVTKKNGFTRFVRFPKLFFIKWR